jgi:hypothetical protein
VPPDAAHAIAETMQLVMPFALRHGCSYRPTEPAAESKRAAGPLGGQAPMAKSGGGLDAGVGEQSNHDSVGDPFLLQSEVQVGDGEAALPQCS